MTSSKRNSLALILVVVVPVLAAVLFYAAGGKALTGADEQAREAVQRVHSYRPWFEPLWSPPSAAVEALLFLAQAVAGAAVLGFAVVRLRARRKP